MLSLIQFRVEMLPLIRNTLNAISDTVQSRDVVLDKKTLTTISDSVQSRKAAPDQKYLKCYLGHTSWTLDVEAEDSESQVEFVFHIFLAGVELLPLVYVLPTVVAPITCISTHYIRYRYKYQDRLYQTTGTCIRTGYIIQQVHIFWPQTATWTHGCLAPRAELSLSVINFKTPFLLFLASQIKILKSIGAMIKYLPREMLYTLIIINSHFTINIGKVVLKNSSN